jgi:hypothetical protein
VLFTGLGMQDENMDKLAEAIADKLIEKLGKRTGPIKWTDLDRQLAREGTVTVQPEDPGTLAVLARIRRRPV